MGKGRINVVLCRLIVLAILMFIVQTGSSEEKFRADGFETLRKNWYNFLTGGTGYKPSYK